MTQIELAQAAGISVQALIKFENGQAVARESTVDKIRQALARRGIEFTNGNRLTVSLDLSKASLPV